MEKIGFGPPFTGSSLGLPIKKGFGYGPSDDYWISFCLGVAVLIEIVGINRVGDQSLDAINPRCRR